METITRPGLDQFKLRSDIYKIASPISYNKRVHDQLDDICSEVITRILEDQVKYGDAYLANMANEQYYNTTIRNKVIKVIKDGWTDPFTWYYQPWWIRLHVDRLLLDSDSERTIEQADFNRAWAKLTPLQQDAIERGERSGNASEGFNTLTRVMNQGRQIPLDDIHELARQGVA